MLGSLFAKAIIRALSGLAVFVALAAAEPLFTSVDVFTAGTEGYHTFRIPAILTSPDGSLIAFAEGRKDNRHDPGGGDIDLVYKLSADQGQTWSELGVLDDPGEGWSASNPTPVTDRTNGRVWILFNRWEPGHGTDSSEPGTANNQSWARSSDDNGRSWSDGVDLTRAVRDYENWGAMFFGPGGAIQARDGRLIAPAARKLDTTTIWGAAGDYSGPLHFMRAYAVFSVDHGVSWKRGKLLHALTDENQLVELADGAIMMDARQNDGRRRWVAISGDGGETWSRPRTGQMLTPVCTSIERYTSQATGDDRSRILWTGPAGPGRRNLVVRVSYDEGQTFRNEKVIYGGLAAYSDLAVLPDKTAGVLWERGVSDGYQFITFTRFDLEFLE